MEQVLVCWLGNTDLRAQDESEKVGLGPIAQAASSDSYDRIFLLSNYTDFETVAYSNWLKKRTNAEIKIEYVELKSPTDFGEIYKATRKILQNIKSEHPKISLTFHLSPGTPAMAAVWIILSKTIFPANLIESSKDHGVKSVSFPFDIAADFIPELVRYSDNHLKKISLEAPPNAPEFSAIIHRSSVMQRTIKRAQKAALRSVPVLIEGESGTGKELFARAIHQAGPRKNKPFIPVNCGAIPAELVESELFGHEKGAFTGAEKKRIGYFEEAHGGTIFLDEIGELPLQAQVKLLRILQENEICRIGSNSPVQLDVRIIAATNKTLIEEINQQRFRTDLFYRLAVVVLKLPALRDRPGDLSLLIDSLMEKVNAESEVEPEYNHKKISANAKNILFNHPWPGNVRELLNTLRRLAIWSEHTVIAEDDVKDGLFPVVYPQSDKILDQPLEDGVDLPAIMGKVASHYLKRAIDLTGDNKSKAAKLLNLSSYQTLKNWMKKYDVQ